MNVFSQQQRHWFVRATSISIRDTACFASHRQSSSTPLTSRIPRINFSNGPCRLSSDHKRRYPGQQRPFPRTTSLRLRSLHTDPSSQASYVLPPPSGSVVPNLRPNRRIVAIGDVHGDLDALHRFLLAAQILHSSSTPDNPVWGGDDTILVQNGDILDRGNKELACLRVLTALARQAPADGGEVILLHGNHEALNAVGMFRYVYGQEVEHDLDSSIGPFLGTSSWRSGYGRNNPVRWATFEPGGFLSRPLYQNMPVAVALGRTLFVHAGLKASHLTPYHNSLHEMNQAARNWFSDPNYRLAGSGVLQSATPSNPAEQRYNAATLTLPLCLGGSLGGTADVNSSPVWMRDYSNPPDRPPTKASVQATLDAALRAVGTDIQRMVVGHTPQSRINAALDGKVWRIDVGASRGVRGGVPEVLEIVHDGGDGEGEDLVSVLTVDGERIPEEKRRVVELESDVLGW